MSKPFAASPHAVASYQRRTGALSGVVWGDWWCKVGQHNVSKHRTAGRKKHASGQGWTCAECAKSGKGKS